MRFLVLAADYDGTLATEGRVDDSTLAALQRLRASGRKLILVTGRHLPDIRNVFPHLDRFDRVIVENGGLLYRPQTREQKPLTEAPNERFLSLLRERSVPFSAGKTIVATWKPHEEEVLKAIRDLGLELQVIFNKGAVMVLPSGVNKGTGLAAALEELQLSPHNVVGVGDAENDHAFLKVCECSVAVDNALPALKERADVVLSKARGAGLTELCEQLIARDLADYDSKLKRHCLTLGQRVDGDKEPLLVNPRGASILVARTLGKRQVHGRIRNPGTTLGKRVPVLPDRSGRGLRRLHRRDCVRQRQGGAGSKGNSASSGISRCQRAGKSSRHCAG